MESATNDDQHHIALDGLAETLPSRKLAESYFELRSAAQPLAKKWHQDFVDFGPEFL